MNACGLMRAAGWGCVAMGTIIALPQVFVTFPNQALFALGLALAIGGGIAVVDE